MSAVLNSLSKEAKLLILASRLTFNDLERNQIIEIVKIPIDWFDFFKLTLYHKTTTLCWKNIKEIVPDVKLPKYLRHILRFTADGIERYNKIQFQEVEKIREALNAGGIDNMPVKGAMLIPEVYRDYSIRYMGDIDILIHKRDTKKITDIMNELGYIQGSYDSATKEIVPLSRKEEIMWKSYMSNLAPFTRLADDLKTVIKIDFRYSLDDSLNTSAVDEILDEFVMANSQYTKSHVLMHLCTHFYDEANHAITRNNGKGFNIIKLCDIREYILRCMSKIDMEETVAFAKKYHYEKQLFFTFSFLHHLYSDMPVCSLFSVACKYGITHINEDFIIKNMFNL